VGKMSVKKNNSNQSERVAFFANDRDGSKKKQKKCCRRSPGVSDRKGTTSNRTLKKK
jgi:hypothetical protein